MRVTVFKNAKDQLGLLPIHLKTAVALEENPGVLEHSVSNGEQYIYTSTA